jgi:zinc protease
MFNFKFQISTLNFALCLLCAFNFSAFDVAAQNSATVIAAQSNLITEFDVNGLKVIVKKRVSSPTVSANLFFRGGVRNVTDKNAGIENLLLGVAAEGSKKFPREVMRRELSKTGSEIGGGAALDFSVFSMASTRQHFERSWEIFTDAALNPSFAREDFVRIQEQALTGLQSQNDDPDNYLQVLKNKTVFAGHPYANSPSGTLETVSALDTEKLRAYHNEMMKTSRMLLVVVGDIEAELLKQKIIKSFGLLPRGSYTESPIPQLSFTKPTVDITSRELPTNYIQGEFPAPGLSNPDYYAMRVAINILQGRVFTEVRVRRNLSYAPSAGMGELNANSGNIYVTTVDANRSISVMLNEIQKLQTEPVDKEEIASVAGGFLTKYFLEQETNSAQAAEIARYELIGGGWRNSLSFFDRVEKITPEKVKAVSVKYMKNIKFVVLGNPAAVNKDIFLQK